MGVIMTSLSIDQIGGPSARMSRTSSGLIAHRFNRCHFGLDGRYRFIRYIPVQIQVKRKYFRLR